MQVDAAVDRWLTETNPALEPAMRAVAETILNADPRMQADLQHGTVTFAFGGDLAAFVQAKGRRVSLMFNRGAAIPGRYPHLEGDGPTARFMRFADLKEVRARSKELARIVAAWCELQTPS